jgi:hypothetical protein
LNWYKFLFDPPFRLVGFFYRAYHANRDRFSWFASRQWVSSGLRKVTVLTLFLWIVIWLLASDESRDQLTNAVRENIGALGGAFTD